MRLSNETIAEIVHETNRTFCRLTGNDFQHKPWAETPQNIRASVIDGVRRIRIGQIKTPQESHRNWLKFKEAEGGWRYGPVKDVENKVHPCFVPYEDLPPEQQIKDMVFFALVNIYDDGEQESEPEEYDAV